MPSPRAATLRHVRRVPSSLTVSVTLLALIALVGAAAPARAQVAPDAATRQTVSTVHDDGPGYPPLDIRFDANGQPRAGEFTARTPEAAAKRAREIAALAAAVPGLAIDDDVLFGTPRFLRSTQAFLTAAPAQKIEVGGPEGLAVLSSFIDAHPALFEFDSKELARARSERDYRTDHNGARHILLQQTINGADLFGCELRANLTEGGALINVGSTIVPRPAPDFTIPAQKFDDAAAIVIAAASVGISIPENRWPAAESEPSGPAQQRVWPTITASDFRVDQPGEPVTTHLVYFPLDRDTIHPAWHVLLPTRGVGHTYEILIDATDGSVLYRHNRLVCETTEPVTMHVYLSDGPAPGSPGTATPTTFQFPVVPRTLMTWQPADVSAFSPNGWINDGDTQTLGNNVDAHTDFTNDNVADTPRPDGGASRVFDFPLDLSQDPSAYSSASVVELFFRANDHHDRLMALGFNEAAGNFQTANFSGLGAGGDAIQADCQDSAANAPVAGSNRSNANFATGGADGSSARVQMYLFNGPTPQRDGSLDGDIVYHEFAHGTSIRLHHGLNNLASTGMGEGWSDFYGIALLAEPTDDPDGVYSTGGYVTYQLRSPTFFQNYYYGFRRYPYSTDLTKNPLTYRFIDPGQLSYPSGVPRNTAITTPASEVHNIGEVWCTMLLECRAKLWHTHGFAGNQRMLQLVTDAMKLSPNNPTFVQARDAILQADLVNHGGFDLRELWTAFAKRGLGAAATAPSSATTNGVVQSSTLPAILTVGYPSGHPAQVAPNTAATFHLFIKGTGITLTPNTAALNLSINSGPYTPIPLTSLGADEFSATIPAQPCGAAIAYYISIGTSAGDKTDPPTAPAARYTLAIVNGPTSSLLSDSFETDTSWTVGPNTATSGAWERAAPEPTSAQPGAAHTGTLCFITGASANLGAVTGVAANDVDTGYTTLVSPTFNLAAYADATITYWRWYSNGAGSNAFTQTLKIDASSDDGATWFRAETVGPGASADTLPGWRQASWTLSSVGLAPTATVKVRVIAEDNAGAVVEAAFDDFNIAVSSCTPPPSCRADFNNSGTLEVQDIFDFINGWFAQATAADFNNSGTLEVQDIFDYLNAWFAGC
jgi:hypothetical protein